MQFDVRLLCYLLYKKKGCFNLKKQYIRPQTVNYGKSENLIQGSCGFGVENWQLNETGASTKNVKRIVRVACNPNLFPGQMWCDYCNTVTVCTREGDHC